MKVLELQPASHVLWQVVDGPEEWIGTRVSFDLKQQGDWTIVLFKHQGWKEPVEFMHHCSTKWARLSTEPECYSRLVKALPIQPISSSTAGNKSGGRMEHPKQ